MSQPVRIGIIGDYEPERPSHKATNEALNHCAAHLGITVELQWLPTESLEEDKNPDMAGFDGFWCSPGVYHSMKGALNGVRFAREHDRPFMGTCAGFQYTVIEYARNKVGLEGAQHAEYAPHAPKLVIIPLSCSFVGETRKVLINKRSRVYTFYGKAATQERFSCNFGINPEYRKPIEESGLRVAGTDENGEVRILELTQNKFFIATLFQPQLSSWPADPHRLILAYLTCMKSSI